jgi:hypothetical protein
LWRGRIKPLTSCEKKNRNDQKTGHHLIGLLGLL